MARTTIVQRDDRLNEMVDRLVAAFDPERIYLFGSRGRGDHQVDSDYDLMVILADSDDPSYRRERLAYGALGPIGIDKDVLVWTQAEFDARTGASASLPATILREGVLVYAR